MGRISKRGRSNGVENAAVKGQKRYKAGIYARLSVDVDEKNESINVQIGIAEKFVKEFNQKNKEAIDIVGHYCEIGRASCRERV